MTDILVVEDSVPIREGIRILLESELYTVREAGDGVEAMRMYAEKRPNLIILDVTLPEKSGFDVCREIRLEDSMTPILMLSAKAEEADKVLGLGLGADDYVSKPFGSRELVARIAALQRRGRHERNSATTFRFGSGVVRGLEQVFINRRGQRIELTAREFALLQLFAARQNEVISRDELLGCAWGKGYFAHTRTLDTRICTLRRKIQGSGWEIQAVIGQGYRLGTHGPNVI